MSCNSCNIEKAKNFYKQGIRFLRCTERCMGDKDESGDILLFGGKNQMLATPTMVNAAFACECFLKSILICNCVHYKKEHGLKALYDLLPAPEYKEWLRIGTDFEQKLEAHSLDLITWRYYIEKPGEYAMDPIFTFILMSNLKILSKRVICKAEERRETL